MDRRRKAGAGAVNEPCKFRWGQWGQWGHLSATRAGAVPTAHEGKGTEGTGRRACPLCPHPLTGIGDSYSPRRYWLPPLSPLSPRQNTKGKRHERTCTACRTPGAIEQYATSTNYDTRSTRRKRSSAADQRTRTTNRTRGHQRAEARRLEDHPSRPADWLHGRTANNLFRSPSRRSLALDRCRTRRRTKGADPMKASQIRALANVADKPGASVSAREGRSAIA